MKTLSFFLCPLAGLLLAYPAISATSLPVPYPPVAHPIQDRVFYFVLPDRFSNGNPDNDRGGISGDALANGFLPTDKAYYHGGDLAGLTKKLDYLQGLGISALWMTPVATNRPVQGDGTLAGSSAGYHGYWVTDFLAVDPHLGDESTLKALIQSAQTKNIQVYFDIIVNHTADVIRYEGNQYSYKSKSVAPYRDAQGIPFDESAMAGKAAFPALDAQTSFPYKPVFEKASDAHVKNPAWLNNPIYYHNRGNSYFEGESNTLGDFSGLDDLFTEHPDVVKGMTEIYKEWISRYSIDGFRVDTVKHVDMPFWQVFSPAVLSYAAAQGRPDFFMFGEVYDHNPNVMSRYSTTGGLSATLDFGFQHAVKAYVTGQGSASDLRDLFEDDDYYTSATRNAYSLPTFLGNHDMGRIGYFIKQGARNETEAQWLARDRLAHALLFFARGVPVVYYGDEQGLTGKGGDKDARQDLFATQVAEDAAEAPLGGEAGAKERFEVTHPLYRTISQLATLRAEHRALRRGAQIHRYSSGGIYAFSRIDRDEKREYLVATNATPLSQSIEIITASPNTTWSGLWGTEQQINSDENGKVLISIPPLSALLLRAQSLVPAPTKPPKITLDPPFVTSDQRILFRAQSDTTQWAEVSFAIQIADGAWIPIGTDTQPPYRLFWDGSTIPKGTPLRLGATISNPFGQTDYSELTFTR